MNINTSELDNEILAPSVEDSNQDETTLINKLDNSQTPPQDSDNANGEPITEVQSEEEDKEGEQPTDPEPTDKEIAELARVEQEKKKRAERREAGKIAYLEKQQNYYEETAVLTAKLLNPNTSLDAFNELIANPKKFNELKPFLDKSIPSLKEYDYNGLVRYMESNLRQSAIENPEQLSSVIELEKAKIRAEIERDYAEKYQSIQAENLKASVTDQINQAIPEFKALNEGNPQQAEEDLFDAVELAKVKRERMTRRGETPDEIKLLIESLRELNPQWKAKQVSTVQAKKQIIDSAKKALSGTSTNQSNSSSVPSEVASMPPQYQEIYKKEVARYIRDGETAQKAHEKTVKWLQSV